MNHHSLLTHHNYRTIQSGTIVCNTIKVKTMIILTYFSLHVFDLKKPHMLWKHPTSYSYHSYSFFLVHRQDLRSQQNITENIFSPHDLDLWPMTLTFKLDLVILPFDLHAKIQVCMSVRLARIVRRTDRRTDTRCQNHYTHHIRDVGCKNVAINCRQSWKTHPDRKSYSSCSFIVK